MPRYEKKPSVTGPTQKQPPQSPSAPKAPRMGATPRRGFDDQKRVDALYRWK